jgi:crotonobetaine/carnitine-CoA ligase
MPVSLAEKAGMNTPLHERTLARVLRSAAQSHGERPFLLFEGRSYSYREAYELSRRIAAGLSAAGIVARQHVAIMMENRPETVWLNFALALIGAVAVPINNAARGDLLAYYVRQSDAVAIIMETAFVERFALVRQQCPLLQLVGLIGSEPGALADTAALGEIDTVAWETLEQSSPFPDASETRYCDVLHILYSSGTTGAAKGSMVANATAIMAAAKFDEVNGYDNSDVFYTCLPLFHGNAWNCTLLPALMAGGTVALSRRFSARNFWREIGESGATQCSLLSAMINILWLQPPSPREREHKLRICQVVPTPEFSTEFERRYNVTIASIYSLSDFGLATILTARDPREKLRSAGRPIAEMSVAILDEDDLPLPPGETGEICLRNNEPWVGRQGYYKMADTFVAATRNLWFHTGDRGWLDEDGYLYFAGRNKELIRRRGENISAIQVEEVIRSHPAVAHAAVFAVRAEFLEDEVMASIVCKKGQQLSQAELVEFCAPRMAYFMVPRFVEIVPELPVTPTGKVEKYKLREAVEPRLSEVWDREKSGIVLER